MSLIKPIFPITPRPILRVHTKEEFYKYVFSNQPKYKSDTDTSTVERFLVFAAVYQCEPFHMRSRLNWPCLSVNLKDNLRTHMCPILLFSASGCACFIDMSKYTHGKRMNHKSFTFLPTPRHIIPYITKRIPDFECLRQRHALYTVYTLADTFCTQKTAIVYTSEHESYTQKVTSATVYAYAFILPLMDITPVGEQDEPPKRFAVVQSSIRDNMLVSAPVDLLGILKWLFGASADIQEWRSRACITWNFVDAAISDSSIQRNAMLRNFYKTQMHRFVIINGVVHYPISAPIVPCIYTPAMDSIPDSKPTANLKFLLQHCFSRMILEYINQLDSMISAYLKEKHAEQNGYRSRVGVVVGKRRRLAIDDDDDNSDSGSDSEDDDDIIVYPLDALSGNLVHLTQTFPVIQRRYDYIRRRIANAKTAKIDTVRNRIPPCLLNTFYTAEPQYGYLKNDLRRDIKNILEHVSHFTSTPMDVLVTGHDIARVRTQPRMKQKSVDAMVEDLKRPRNAKYGPCVSCAYRRQLARTYTSDTTLTHVPCPVDDIEDCLPRKTYSHKNNDERLTPYHVMADAPHDIHLTYF